MAKTAIVVYLGENYFAAIEVKTNTTGGEILRYTIHQLPESGFSGEWLAEIWKKEYFGHTKVISLLPQGLVKYKSLSLPNLPDEQLQAAVRMDLENSESGSVYRIVNLKKEEQHTSVKLTLIKDAELESYLNQIRSAGLTIEWAGLNHHGIQNYLAFNFDFFEGSGADIYLSLNDTCSELGALTDTELLYRRALLTGANQLKEDASKYLPEFIEELRLSLASYQAANNTPLPEQIWVFGAAKPEKIWLEQLSAALGIQFVVSDQTRLSGVITGSYTAGLAPLIGLALDETWLSRKDWRFNTRNQVRQERNRQKTLTVIKAGLAGVLLIIGLLLGVQARAIRNQKNAAWLDSQKEIVSRLRKVETDTSQKVAQLKTLEAWLNHRGHELEFLRIIEASLPEQTQITDLIIEDETVKGLSGSTRSVSALLGKLQRTPELRTFKLKGSITIDKSGMELFQLEGRFTPGEKAP